MTLLDVKCVTPKLLMTDANTLLERLHDSLTTLQQRWANLGPDAPASLTLEIEDHQTAITLTEQLAAGHLTETAWREQLRPLLVTIEARQATEAVSALNIGGVSFSNINGSTITVGNINAGVHAGSDVVGGDKVSQTAYGSNIAQASHGGKATVNVTDLRGQQVSGDQYNVGGDQHIHQTETEPPFWKRLSRVQLILAIVLGLIATGAAVLAVPGVSDVVYGWFIPPPFSPAAEGESLIVIATFHETAANQTEPHVKIKRAVEDAAAEVGLDDLRVEVEPTILTADQHEEAEALGAAYNAEMVIWGEDTGVQVLVNFYNLKQPDFIAADVPITENERTQVVNPSAYAEFILNDLPGQLTFLAFFAVGQSYFSSEQYHRATEIIEAGIMALSDDARPDGLADAYFRLGWLYEAIGDPQTANIRYTSSIALVPSLVTYNNRGLTYVVLEQYDEALADFNEALRLKPDDAFVYTNRGSAYAALEQYDNALADFNESLHLNPEDVVAFYNRGLTYANLEQYDKALVDYSEALRLNPDYDLAYNNRGLTYANLEQYDEALADYSEALRLNPNYADAYNNRGNTYYALERYDEALADFNEALRLNPDYSTAFYNRGLTYANLEQYDKALADYSEALRLNPNYVTAYINRGLIYANLEQYDEALADYNEALRLNLDYADTYNNRGNTYYALERYDEALVDYNKALDLDPDDTDAYINRGATYVALEQYDEALADYSEALRLDPDDTDAYINRGATYVALERYDEALADYSEALRLNPDLAFAYYNRGLLYAAQDKLERAIENFETGLQVDLNPTTRQWAQEQMIDLKAQLENQSQ